MKRDQESERSRPGGEKPSSREKPSPASGSAKNKSAPDDSSPAAKPGLAAGASPAKSRSGSPLRVDLSRGAYADIALHARESLDAEVCGVLVGDAFEDDEGLSIQVQAALQGTAAREGATHVTFTHETWDRIHQRIDHEFPDARIVGWYHSHPGFGVEFSEMDLFIQRNFFPAPHQIALVTDPLGGDTAVVCIPDGATVTYLDRIRVEGKEVRCVVPRARDADASRSGNAAAGADGSLADVIEGLRQSETRLQQLLQSVEDQRAALTRFLYVIGFLLGAAILLFFGYNLYLVSKGRVEPPKLLTTVPVPVQIGNDILYVDVSVTGWKIPDSVDVIRQIEKQVRIAIEAEQQQALERKLLEEQEARKAVESGQQQDLDQKNVPDRKSTRDRKDGQVPPTPKPTDTSR